MHENVLTPIKVFVSQKYAERPTELCEMLLAPLIEVCENIYSYLIYAEYENKTLSGWTIQYVVSQDEQYNTLKLTDVVAQIAADIIKNNNSLKKSYIIGYKQPPLDILCELFDPLMQKLAYNQHIKWPKLEQEDLLQMCRLTMCILYSKGYYINRRLLEQSFYNAILMQLRKDKNMPLMVSIDDRTAMSVSGDGSAMMSVEDTIADMQLVYEEQDKEDDEEYQQIVEEERQIIVDMIGQRQYDQLVREYGNHCTTCRGQRQVARIKGKLKEDKILKEN